MLLTASNKITSIIIAGLIILILCVIVAILFLSPEKSLKSEFVNESSPLRVGHYLISDQAASVLIIARLGTIRMEDKIVTGEVKIFTKNGMGKTVKLVLYDEPPLVLTAQKTKELFPLSKDIREKRIDTAGAAYKELAELKGKTIILNLALEDYVPERESCNKNFLSLIRGVVGDIECMPYVWQVNYYEK